jgi:hypothetical protein
MALPTLSKFLNGNKELAIGYVQHPGFANLYLRKTYRYIDRARVRTLDIAYVVARRPGSGAFTKLLDLLHPTWNLYVEGVINPDFREYLVRRGFRHVDTNGLGLPNYFLHTLQELVPYERTKCSPKLPTPRNTPRVGA